MALTIEIRRESSRILPLALRAFAGSYQHWGSALLAAVRQPSRNTFQKPLFPAFLNHYSSKPSSDASLRRTIDTKLQDALDYLEAEKVPEGFPFEIEDHPGQKTITLRREYEGETITVEVHIPTRFTGKDDDIEDDIDDDKDKDKDNENDNTEEDKSNRPSFLMVVRVSQNEGHYLEFNVTALPDRIYIDSLSIKDPKSSEDQLACDEIDVDQYMDENFEKDFIKYLEIRGITDSTTEFLYGFMGDKDWREYIACLKKLQNLIQA